VIAIQKLLDSHGKLAANSGSGTEIAAGWSASFNLKEKYCCRFAADGGVVNR
jgi:hypothetical protein